MPTCHGGMISAGWVGPGGPWILFRCDLGEACRDYGKRRVMSLWRLVSGPRTSRQDTGLLRGEVFLGCCRRPVRGAQVAIELRVVFSPGLSRCNRYRRLRLSEYPLQAIITMTTPLEDIVSCGECCCCCYKHNRQYAYAWDYSNFNYMCTISIAIL